jgi:hypothetical protein
MSDQSTRTHFYHADANAIGGRIERPFEQIVPIQAPLSLPAVGGYGTARTENFRFAGILSARSVETQVAGSRNEQNGSWTTVVSAIVEGLNVSNVITADRVIAQISTEHPAEGYTPKVSFVGTQFVNLSVSGKKTDPVIDLGYCDQGDPDDYPKQPCILNPQFLKKADEQHQGMRPTQEETSRSGRYLEWLKQRYPVGQSEKTSGGALNQERGMVLCSLVQEIQGDRAGKSLGHVLVIPEFGKVFLCELLLDHNSFHLIMLRFELGCPVVGCLGVCDTRTNGSSYP